ncbi:hypothetical protein [Corynebacterium antarcticum]|uniref:hypothetical protein n=1 Tax=Corynebacterium antarcticum TaxID=2800405 RepID=UPI002260912D|nr:hypothetical protein [Corynebacterium antarcticum]MCX7540399.1 hypothetical protein [Corynebacterium antarcticum]
MLPEHWVALDRSIGPVRMGTYVAAAEGDSDRARALYLWDRELAAAFFADLAILEVALRNAMSARLKDEWGCEWYRNPDMPLDDRSLNTLSTAWQRITGEKTADRLVAQCMFGFWRGLLDAGSYTGKKPRRIKCDYEVLWRGVLDKAFPGGRALARAENQRWNREYAFAVVSRVNELRNRVAHHEPLINGFPLPGQRVRVTAREAHEDTMHLAAMLDRDLHTFLSRRSRVREILDAKP